MESDLTFHTHEGTAVAATFAAPPGEGPFPAVLLCQGLSGVRNLVLPRVAEVLSESGFGSLRFDYSGYGDSGGERGWIDPFSRVVDARYALAALMARDEVDSDRVGVYGHSYGGPVAIHVAAEDGRVRALAAVSSPGSGGDMLRAPRPEWEWVTLVHRLDQERTAIAGGAKATIVGVEEIFPFSPKFTADYAKLRGGGTSAMATGSGLGTSHFYLASIDRMAVFDPEAAARGLTRCPTLLVHGKNDDTAPISTVEPVYRAIPGPKQWQVITGADHNTLDTEPGLTSTTSKVADWFTHHLSRQ